MKACGTFCAAVLGALAMWLLLIGSLGELLGAPLPW